MMAPAQSQSKANNSGVGLIGGAVATPKLKAVTGILKPMTMRSTAMVFSAVVGSFVCS